MYFSIRCITECTFTLVLDVISVTPYTNQTVTTLNPRSTTIFSYLIPTLTQNSTTNLLNIQVQSYQLNSPFSLYLVPSNYFGLVNDKEQSILIDGGKAILFSSADINWCTNCTVYFVLAVRIYS